MTNKQKLINLYKQASKTGKLPNEDGLCNELDKLKIKSKNLLLFYPSEQEESELSYCNKPVIWWGRESFKCKLDDFTPLRQIVLGFLICMED